MNIEKYDSLDQGAGRGIAKALEREFKAFVPATAARAE
jgi:hypothetical protein